LVTFACVCCPMAAIGSLLDGGTATPTGTVRSLLLPTLTEAPRATATQARAPTARAMDTAAPSPVATRTVVPMATGTRPLAPSATQAPAATATMARVSTATLAPAPTATQAAPVAVCDCSGDLYNCRKEDFATHAAAQACYEYCWRLTGRDVHGLDGNDGDGVACESLP